jgi:hypothetical protein
VENDAAASATEATTERSLAPCRRTATRIISWTSSTCKGFMTVMAGRSAGEVRLSQWSVAEDDPPESSRLVGHPVAVAAPRRRPRCRGQCPARGG